MAFWREWIKPATKQPLFEDELIYPLHFLDDTKTLRGIVVAWTLRFNHVLDAEKLRGSLSQLIEIGDWKKLGGRLRLNSNGALEIVVPSKFSPEHPAIAYTHQIHNMNIDEHELGKQLPAASADPSLQAGPQLFRDFAAHKDAPSNLEDFLGKDVPQLSLYITSFNDATLVSLSWPHTLMDVMGQKALVHAWSLVLAGRQSEVPTQLSCNENALTIASKDSNESFKLASLRLKGLAMIKFGARFAWDMIWNKSLETRTIYLPKWTLSALRDQAARDLKNEGDGSVLSANDILTAWIVRMIASSLPAPRPITVLHALNARMRVKSLREAPGVFIQNMAVAAFTFLPFEVAKGALGLAASQNRSQLLEQASEGQILAFIKELEDGSKSGSDPATYLCGSADALLVPFTNWTRAELFDAVNFEPAVVKSGHAGGGTTPPGRLLYHHATALQPSPSIGNMAVVTGKDHDENYWLSLTLLPGTWIKMEEEIKRLCEEHSKSS